MFLLVSVLVATALMPVKNKALRTGKSSVGEAIHARKPLAELRHLRVRGIAMFGWRCGPAPSTAKIQAQRALDLEPETHIYA